MTDSLERNYLALMYAILSPLEISVDIALGKFQIGIHGNMSRYKRNPIITGTRDNKKSTLHHSTSEILTTLG